MKPASRMTRLYNCCRQEGITHIALMGVHTDFCILNRSYGIRQMTRLNFQVVLARGLTHAIYDPRAALREPCARDRLGDRAHRGAAVSVDLERESDAGDSGDGSAVSLRRRTRLPTDFREFRRA
jgi:hypothetical protein